MNCANHVDVPATAYCRTCGKPLCAGCARDVRGVIYCEECLASHLSGAMPPPGNVAVPPGAQLSTGMPSPRLAALLGFIPGVGAMYNGEYAKAFVHVGIFAALVAVTAHGYWPFAFGIAAWVIYMPIEAYNTAKARQMGLPAPDPFGLNNLFSAPGTRVSPAPGVAAGVVSAGTGGAPAGVVSGQPTEAECYPPSRVPVGAIILIGLGVLFLLDEVGWMHFDWIWRFWPVILIAIGIRILMARQRRGW